MRSSRLIAIALIAAALSLALPAGANAAPESGPNPGWPQTMREAMRRGGVPFGPGMMAGRSHGSMMRAYGFHPRAGMMDGTGNFDHHDGASAFLIATIAVLLAALATAAAMIARRRDHSGPNVVV